MEVYVDDILVKSLKCSDHVQYLEEVFTLLRKYNMKLNLEKSTFRVASRRFLGYLVTQRRIEANSIKISAILEMKTLLTSRKSKSSTDASLPSTGSSADQPINALLSGHKEE